MAFGQDNPSGSRESTCGTKTRQSVEDAFQEKKRQGKPAFIPFITGGYPTYADSIDIALALQDAGASILEVGFPYSDPLADGPVIQASSQAALANGMTFSKGLELVRSMRQAGLTIPLIIFCYYNPILQFGLDPFAKKAREVGANGVLIPDLPHEEADHVRRACRQNDLVYISLVAPTSKARIRRIVSQAEGFIYCISSLGVTGVRENLSAQLDDFLKRIRRHTDKPLAVGFGVSKREHVEQLSSMADGIIIGSALINLITERRALFGDGKTKQQALLEIKTFVQGLFSNANS